MASDDKTPPFPVVNQFWLRVLQLTVFCIVMFGAIWFQEANDYPINPLIIGAWAFMAAYGATLLVLKLAAIRRAPRPRRHQ